MKTVLISSNTDRARDLDSADWVLVTDDESFVMKPVIVAAREAITVPPRLRRWTDDYNSLIPILRKR
jgi:hypothetical protein